MQISGNAVVFQLGKESTYGTAVTATQQVAISSESIKPIYAKVDEGLATGGRGEGRLQTMGKRAGGSLSTLLRPDMGLFLELLAGRVATTGEGPYTHTYTAANADEARPSATLIVDRSAGVYGYAGAMLNSMALSAEAGNYVKVDFEFNAKSEENGTKAALTPSALKAFRFAGGSMKIGGTAAADIKSISMNWSNNDDVETQTTSTGENYLQPQHGVRQITVDATMVWSSVSKSLMDSYFKSDATVAIEVNFTSDEKSALDPTKNYSLKITIPCAQCSDAGANMGSPTEFLQQSMSFKAVDNLADELCTIELVNDIE